MAARKLQCLRCGGEMELWASEFNLPLSEGFPFSVPHRCEVDVYSCRQCGKLEFFHANFTPKPSQEEAPPESDEGVDTTGFYVPGVGEEVKCPRCGKAHPSDDAFCPLCGLPRRDPEL